MEGGGLCVWLCVFVCVWLGIKDDYFNLYIPLLRHLVNILI